MAVMKKKLSSLPLRKEVSTKEVQKLKGFLTSAEEVDKILEFWSCLFYGRSGTGKTTLFASYPKPALLLDFKDKGTNSIRNVKGIKVLKMQDWSYVEGTYWELKKGGHGYKTIGFDTVDGMAKLAMSKVRADNGKDDTEALSQREWGELGNLLTTWLFNYRDLTDEGVNVVFLSQQREKNVKEDYDVSSDDDQLDPEVGANLIPSVTRTLNAAVNIIGNTYIKQTKTMKNLKPVITTSFMLRIGPHPFYITKIRKPKEYVLPASIENPTYEKLMKIIKGEKI